MPDWFTENAPKDDWFAANAPSAPAATEPVQRLGGADMIRALAMKALNGKVVPSRAANAKAPVVPNSDPVNAAIINLEAKAAALPGQILRSTPLTTAKESVQQSLQDIQPYLSGKKSWSDPVVSPSEVVQRVAGSVGIDANEVASDARNRDWPALAGDTAFPIMLTLLGGKLARKSQVPASELTGKLPRQVITPGELSARAITKAVNPAVQDWNNYIQAVEAERPNIVEFAQRTGNPLRTQLEWAKAAQGAAEEAHSYYKQNVVAPVADTQTSVAGTGYKGRTVGEGPNATIGDIDARISAINREIRTAYMKREQGQVGAALANEAELTAERDALARVLHSELSRATGVPAEEIAALRQRFGRMYSISDQTTSAVNQRMSSAGKAVEGRRDVPLTTASAVADVVNKVVRGGPEKIADRQLRRALKSPGQPPKPLPDTSNVPKTVAAIKARAAARKRP